jgi:hypothetical protein
MHDAHATHTVIQPLRLLVFGGDVEADDHERIDDLDSIDQGA